MPATGRMKPILHYCSAKFSPGARAFPLLNACLARLNTHLVPPQAPGIEQIDLWCPPSLLSQFPLPHFNSCSCQFFPMVFSWLKLFWRNSWMCYQTSTSFCKNLHSFTPLCHFSCDCISPHPAHFSWASSKLPSLIRLISRLFANIKKVLYYILLTRSLFSPCFNCKKSLPSVL